MDKLSLEHHIKHLETKHKDLELDLMEAHARWNDNLASKIKKEKLQLKDEIEKFKKQLETI
jgi:hypothetical protein